jgi:hypothetical protein
VTSADVTYVIFQCDCYHGEVFTLAADWQCSDDRSVAAGQRPLGIETTVNVIFSFQKP